MNYPQLQTYLKEKILTIEINNEEEEIKGLQAEFLTAQELTASTELTELFARFYQSVVATITPVNANNVHLLPDYEQLTKKDYLVTNKTGLGKTETDISEEHYKLLDKVIAEFKESIKDDTPVTKLQSQTESIKSQVNELFKSKTEGEELDTNLMAEMIKLLGTELQQAGQTKPGFVELIGAKKAEDCQPLFKLLLAYPESKPIVAEIKQWLVDYQKLTQPEQELLQKEHKGINQVDQIIISCQPKQKKKQDSPKKENDKETTETLAKADPEKNKQDLMYFGGFILLLAIAASFFKDK